MNDCNLRRKSIWRTGKDEAFKIIPPAHGKAATWGGLGLSELLQFGSLPKGKEAPGLCEADIEQPHASRQMEH